MNLTAVPTAELVAELAKRDGVAVWRECDRDEILSCCESTCDQCEYQIIVLEVREK